MTASSQRKAKTKLIHWLNYEPVIRLEAKCDFERLRYELRPCDVILVEGYSRVSRVIRWITNSPWTHAALYIGRLHDIEDPQARERLQQHLQCSPDTQIVIESQLGYGTIATPLTMYQNDHLRICRPQGLNHKDAQDVMRYGTSRLGMDYDVRQIFDLLRFLFPWNLLPRRWRSSLFTKTPSQAQKTVCSTMIAEAFGYVQFPILPLVKRSDDHGVQLFRRNPKLCVPSHFDYSPYFEIIKYPFVDFSQQASHRLLPWKGNAALTGDEASYYMNESPRAELYGEQLQSRFEEENHESDTQDSKPKQDSKPDHTNKNKSP